MSQEYASEAQLLQKGRELLGKSLFEIYSKKSVREYEIRKGKGVFGDLIEELHYGIKNNNKAAPDVENLKIEIKTNPLVRLADNRFSPKEVVSLGMIDFTQLAIESFKTSTFLSKNKNILYNMFWYEDKMQPAYLYKVILVDLIKIPVEDLKVIEKDWLIIQNKVLQSEADKLSKRDTFYLAAGTKGGKNQKQIPYKVNGETAYAKKRAFVFKTSYIRSLLNNYSVTWEKDIPVYIKHSSPSKIKLLSEDDYGDIESAVLSRFKPFLGFSDIEIAKSFKQENMFFDGKAKARWHFNSSLILTGKKKKFLSNYIDEFSKSGLTVKTIRVNKDYKPFEEVSFRTQDYSIQSDSKWSNSSLYDEMSNKFLWILYKKIDGDFILDNVFFWSMPVSDFAHIKDKWLQYKNVVLQNDFRTNYFMNDDSFYYMKIKDNKGGANKTYSGKKVTSLSHWFRKSYVRTLIADNLK